MRSLSLLTLTTLAVVELTVVPLVFDGSAIAATAHAEPNHKDHAGPAKRSRVARSACQPLHVSREQLINGVLNLPWFIGKSQPLYINGQRLCVDPHPYSYYTDPETGAAVIQGR